MCLTIDLRRTEHIATVVSYPKGVQSFDISERVVCADSTSKVIDCKLFRQPQK